MLSVKVTVKSVIIIGVASRLMPVSVRLGNCSPITGALLPLAPGGRGVGERGEPGDIAKYC